MITPDTFELPEPVIAALRDLTASVCNIVDPIERLAVIRTVGKRVDRIVSESLTTLTVREALRDGNGWPEISAALGVSERTAHFMARTKEPN